MKNYVEKSEGLKNHTSASLTESMRQLEAKIWEEIYRMLEGFDISGGSFVFSDASTRRIIEIENKILSVLKESGYYNRVGVFLKDFSKISENVKRIHEGENKAVISNESLTKTEKLFSKTTAEPHTTGVGQLRGT